MSHEQLLILVPQLILLGLSQALLARILLVPLSICNHYTLLALVAELLVILAHLRLSRGPVLVNGLLVDWLQLVQLQSLLLLLLVIVLDLSVDCGWLVG